MGAKKCIIDFSDEDRETLESFISTGERTSRSNTRARILLKADDGLTDATISEHVGCHPQTARDMRTDYTDRGLVAIHRRKPDREYDRKLDDLAEIGSTSISHEAVRQRLKTTLKPYLSRYWEMPPSQDGDFVSYMEDVLNLSHEPCDVIRPVITLPTQSAPKSSVKHYDTLQQASLYHPVVFPAGSTRLTIAAAGRSFPRRRLLFEPRTLLTGFVYLGWTVTIFLQMCPDEVEAALEGGFDLSDSYMNSNPKRSQRAEQLG